METNNRQQEREGAHLADEHGTSSSAISIWDRLRRTGSAFIAILLYILLIDTSIETFLSGSEVRYWVAGAVAVYLALSAAMRWGIPWLRERFTWSGSVALSLLLLLGILVFTGYKPGGLAEGVVLFRQPTSSVLAAVTVLAVAYATFILMQRRFLHISIRLLLSAIAIYGIAAFVIGIMTNTPYADMFRGGSFWQKLPFWLQGAIVGGVVIISLSLLSHLMNGVLKVRGSALRARGFQMVCLILCVLLALEGFLFELPLRGERIAENIATEKPRQSTTTQLTREQAVEKLDKLFNALAAAEKEIPRDTFDPNAIIATVGKDPVKLFDWVRDNTVLVPYQGVLRGHMGVLMDRVGNSLDRSLLLHELLRLAGHRVRLARGTLTEDRAAELYANLKPLPIRKYEQDDADLEATIVRYASEFGIDASEIRGNIEKTRKEQDRLAGQVIERVRRQTDLIIKAVGLPDSSAEDEERAKQKKALQDHWWVQWQKGNEWKDMDPATHDADIGQTLTSTSSIRQPNQLGEDLHHTVKLRVIAEFVTKGKLKEEVVLSHTLVPSKLFGEPIVLRHIPMNWPKDLNLFEEKNPEKRLKELVLAEKEWFPVLTVGKKDVFRYSIDVNKGLTTPLEKTVPKIPKGAINIFDDLPGGETKAKDSSTELTAEWMEYEIRSPGMSAQTIRRQVFDFLGPDKRKKAPSVTSLETDDIIARGLALMGKTEILPLVSDISPEYVHHLTARSMAKNKAVLLELFGAPGTVTPKSMENMMGKVTPLPGASYSLVLARRSWSRFRSATYLDQTNIFSFHNSLRIAPGGELLGQSAFDIVKNDLAARPDSNYKRFAIRLEHGVLDTNAEASILTTCGDDCNYTGNTAELFALSEEQGIKWIMLRSEDDRNLKDIALPSNIMGRLQNDLLKGYVLLVPEKPVQEGNQPSVGWWRINSKSGDTLGIGKHGGGSVYTEVLVQLSLFIGFVACLMTIKAGDLRAGGGAQLLCGLGLGITAIGGAFLLGGLVSMNVAATMYFISALLLTIAPLIWPRT